VLAASISTPSRYAGPAYIGPLFDAHSHATPRFISAEELVQLFREVGLSGVFLFGPPKLTLRVQKQNPDFIFPFGQVGRDRQTRQLLLNNDTLRRIEGQLKSGAMRGIGEVSLRHRPFRVSPPNGDANPADGPIMQKLYDLAATRGIPVTVHFEHQYSTELERALQQNRNTIIIWAHLGDGQPSLVKDMMTKHPNLYADISARNPVYERRARRVAKNALTNGDGTLEEEWRSVFEEFPDRFLAGLDIGVNRHLYLTEVVKYVRTVLGQLTQKTAEKIAFRNAGRLRKLSHQITLEKPK